MSTINMSKGNQITKLNSKLECLPNSLQYINFDGKLKL